MKHYKIFSIKSFRSIALLLIVTSAQIGLFCQGFNMKKMSNISGFPGNECSAVFGYVASNGDEYAIIGSKQAINILFVHQCDSLTSVATIQDGFNTSWREFATYQNYLYSICDGSCNSGLTIINMDNIHLSPPTVTNQTSVFTKGHTIFVDKDNARLYVMGSSGTSGNRLLIFTLDTEVVDGITYNGTPQNPVLLRNFSTPYIHDMYVKDNIGFASLIYNYKLNVYDLTNPSNIPVIHEHNYGSGSGMYNHSTWLHHDGLTLYEAIEIPRGEPLRLFKRDPQNYGLDYLGVFGESLEYPSVMSRPHNPHQNGNLLYVSYYEDGVQVFDVSDVSTASAIKRVAYYDTYTQNNGFGYPNDFKGCWGVYPFLPSGCILASDINNGLFTLELDIPANPTLTLGQVSLVDNSDLYAAGNNAGIILRSPKGYCYKLLVDQNGLSTQRVICHTYGESFVSIEKMDLAFNNHIYGPILQDVSGTCFRVKLNIDSNIEVESVGCIPSLNQVSVPSHKTYIASASYGIILKNEIGACSRISVDDNGIIHKNTLQNCP